MKAIPLILFMVLLSFSCTNYYQLNRNTEQKELYRIYKIEIEKDTLEFGAYLDYYHDSINHEMIYANRKELNKILKSGVHKKPRQILFLHNDTQFYLNIFGFYYPDLYLTEIAKPKLDYQEIPVTMGKAYHYMYNQKPVSDFYVPYKNGILRFIAIGNPTYYPERFNMEIDFVFFVLNPKLLKLKPEHFTQ